MSNCNTNSWICFDFQNNRVAPTDYTIRSPTGWGDNSPEPQNWVIEGSNDNSSWDLLSEENTVRSFMEKEKFTLLIFIIKHQKNTDTFDLVKQAKMVMEVII